MVGGLALAARGVYIRSFVFILIDKFKTIARVGISVFMIYMFILEFVRNINKRYRKDLEFVY